MPNVKEAALPGEDWNTLAELILQMVNGWSAQVPKSAADGDKKMWETMFEATRSVVRYLSSSHDFELYGAYDPAGLPDRDPLLRGLGRILDTLVELQDLGPDELKRLGGPFCDLVHDLAESALGAMPPEIAPSIGPLQVGIHLPSQFKLFTRRKQAEEKSEQLARGGGHQTRRNVFETNAADSPGVDGATRLLDTSTTVKNFVSESTADTSEQRGLPQRPAEEVASSAYKKIESRGATQQLWEHFNDHAIKQGKTAQKFRTAAISLISVAIGIAFLTYLLDPPDSPWTFSWRLSILLGTLGLAGYIARQSTLHRDRETWASTITIQLRAFEHFIAPINNEDSVDRIRRRFSEHVFLGQPAGGKSPRDRVDLQPIVNGAGDVLKGARDS